MALDINKIKQRFSTLQNQTKKQDSLWKPPAGKSVIRIVPYKFNKDNPFIELLFHYGIGGKSYLSPKTFGRPDPIVEFAEGLKKTGSKDDYKLAKTLEPKLRTYVPVVVRGEEEAGVKFWGFGKTVYLALLDTISDADYGDITDPVNGRDVTVEFKTAEETGKSFPSTTIRVKPTPTPLTTSEHVLKAIAESQKNILDVYKELSYDELKAVLADWLNPKNKEGQAATASAPSDDEEVVQPTKKQSTKSATPAPTVALNMEDINKSFDELFEQPK